METLRGFVGVCAAGVLIGHFAATGAWWAAVAGVFAATDAYHVEMSAVADHPAPDSEADGE